MEMRRAGRGWGRCGFFAGKVGEGSDDVREIRTVLMGEELRVEVSVGGAFGMAADDVKGEGLPLFGEDHRGAGLLSAEHHYIGTIMRGEGA
jgi:hypothetical protein